MSLPPVPASLKSIAPYLQRADELRKQEPVIAYWCTYYAAQVGIALKVKDVTSRNFLFELLGSLEKMKEDIGPTDAIDIESASAAFVENFALRVFGMADNEDRSGAGNRSTAKKFLAAANFLEVLKTFPKTEISETNEEKIRYAKWKAADIAKAYREGRKPTPGPAAGDPEIEAELLQLAGPLTSSSADTLKRQLSGPPTTFSSDTVRGSPPAQSQISAPPSSTTPPKVKRTSPHMDISDIANANRDFVPITPPGRGSNILGASVGLQPGSWGGQGEATPGSWSTAATPGMGTTPQEVLDEPQSPSLYKGKGKERTGSGSSSGSGPPGGLLLRADGPPADRKTVHFTPSVVGDSPVSPTQSSGEKPPWQGSVLFNGTDLPLGFVPVADQQHSSSHASPQAPHGGMHSSAPPQPPAFNGGLYPSAPPLPSHGPTPVVPPPPTFVPPPTLVSPPPPPPPRSEPVELTPTIIAKAQKHCRFAISALDYEDAEQARRELRAALATLGG